jgi:hypothetical protein
MTSGTRTRRKTLSGKDLALSTVITLVFCILPLAWAMWCWSVTKIPPQIFGNNEDHFRGHVIDPIPESVEILDVEFDDIIIHPDVAYYFRFTVSRDDLEKIIDYRSLKTADECSVSYSYPPEWWDVSPSDDVEAYEYNNSSDGLFITLCYNVSSKTAYYLFSTN